MTIINNFNMKDMESKSKKRKEKFSSL